MLSKFLFENFRLKTHQIFSGLTSMEFELLIGSGVKHSYKKGEILFKEGGIPTGIFYVNKGFIKKYKATPKGGQQIFYLCGEDELLGYHALLGEEHYSDSAAAIEDSELTFIPKDTFLEVLRNSTVLSNGLLKALGHEFSMFINNITNLGSRSVRERLAFTLLILEEKYKVKGRPAGPVEIRINRTDLANMVSTAKETVVRMLHDLKNDDIITTTARSVSIINHTAIIKIADISLMSKP